MRVAHSRRNVKSPPLGVMKSPPHKKESHITRGRTKPTTGLSGAVASQIWLVELDSLPEEKLRTRGRGIGWWVGCPDILLCEFGAPIPPKMWNWQTRRAEWHNSEWVRQSMRNLVDYITLLGLNHIDLTVMFTSSRMWHPSELYPGTRDDCPRLLFEAIGGRDIEVFLTFFGMGIKPHWARPEMYQVSVSGETSARGYEKSGMLDSLHPEVSEFTRTPSRG